MIYDILQFLVTLGFYLALAMLGTSVIFWALAVELQRKETLRWKRGRRLMGKHES